MTAPSVSDRALSVIRPVMIHPSLAVYISAGSRAARVRADAAAVVLRSQTIRALAATLLQQGDKPWRESSTPDGFT